MSWSCIQVEERLSDHLDGALTQAERLEFQQHVASCAKCAPLVARVALAIGRVHNLEQVEAPAKLVSNILDKTLGPRKAKRDWRAWLPVLWQPRFAMGIATGLAALLIIFQATGGLKPNGGGLANLSPVKLFRDANSHAHLVFARAVMYVNDLRVVYEIQTRLQPANNPPPAGQQTAPAPSQQEQKNPNQSRQDQTSIQRMALVAVLLEDAPGRRAR
ncbi:MAG TPA: zf-HC2 domain-containing protein [Candidatus Acidoferrales bacterium]|nr:zf-HC2 domain-containing protein [Candidatus Acidoferrales bacterium]